MKKNTGPYADKNNAKLTRLFIELRSGKNLEEACKKVDLSIGTVRKWRSKNPKFKAEINRHLRAYQRPIKLKASEDPTLILELLALIKEGKTIGFALESLGLDHSDYYRYSRESQFFREQYEYARAIRPPFAPKVDIDLSWNEIDLGFTSSSHLYFMHVVGSDLIKIGISKDPTSRLKGICGSCPYPVKIDTLVINGGMYERPIHQMLYEADLYSHGEWFKKEGQAIALEYLNAEKIKLDAQPQPMS